MKIVLPLNCEATYEAGFLTTEEALQLYQHLINHYQINQAFLRMQFPDKEYISDFGKISFTSQQWINQNYFPEQGYGKCFVWDDMMLDVKTKVESYYQVAFGICVCIYYPDGNTGVDFHSDLRAFGDLDVIPSISLGAERQFLLRSKDTQEEFDILLENGSILIMGKNCQERYEHALPLAPDCQSGRINLTFRKVDSKK